MKLNKTILGTAALIAGAATLGAQQASLHGYMDYTNFAVGQNIYKDSKDGDWEHTEAAAEYGSFYNGRTELNLLGNVANVDFALGVRLDSALGEWYKLYKDADGDETMFHQANFTARFLNDQIKWYEGKFEEWSAGYVYNGYLLGGQGMIAPLAERGVGQYVTALEFLPTSLFGGVLNGFRMIADVPLIPPSDEYDYTEANKLSEIWKKVKLAGQYRWMAKNIVFNFGFQNQYYQGQVAAHNDGENFSTLYYHEAYLQLDFPSLFYTVPFNATYSIRWRSDKALTSDLTYEDFIASAHYFAVSGAIKGLPEQIGLTWEERLAYADDNYMAVNEKVLYDMFGVGITKPIPGTQYVLGLNLYGMYGQDANGKGFKDGRCSGDYFPDFNFEVDWLSSAADVTTGYPTKYFGAYIYPSFTKNFQNGFFQVGIEVQYDYFTNEASTTQNIIYRVPFKFCFWY